jgi:hypothetical protein
MENKIQMNEGIFNNNHRNIEFYSENNSFTFDDLDLWKMLINKKVKIFK